MLKKIILTVLDHIESYICQFLLAFFVLILFLQVLCRELGFSLSWSTELSLFAFIWFVYFGASFAARLGAHNRVRLHLQLFPPIVGKVCLLITDIIWIIFNSIMVWYGYKEVMLNFEFPVTSQVLGWQSSYVFMVFPISFALMSVRIIQVNYIQWILKQEIADPDAVHVEQSKQILREKEG